MTHRYPLPEPINLDLNLTVGQAFRWRREGSAWLGWDAGDHYRINVGWVESSASPEQFARLFRLDVPLPGLHRDLIDRGPELAAIIMRWPGLRLMRPGCPRETLFTFLCTSNNHISRITTMVSKMVLCGREGFPTLEEIAERPQSAWRSDGFGYRGRTIPEVAREILRRGGESWFDEVRNRPYADAYGELLTLPGVGPKLADCIALYAFDMTEAAPVDTHLWQAYQSVYGATGTLTDARKREVGDALRGRFGELAGFAQQFLFVDHLRRR